MTKQAETSKNTEQVEDQTKSRNSLDRHKNINDNVLDLYHIGQLDQNEQNFEKNLNSPTGPIKTHSSSSNNSYKADYSTTSSRMSNCPLSGKHITATDSTKKRKNEAELPSDQSSEQESSLLDISFSSSINSENLKTSSNLELFSTSVTNITDFSQSTFMEPQKDQIKISKKTYLGSNRNLKPLGDGWIMKETIIKSTKKSSLEKGTSDRKRSKSRQSRIDLDHRFTYSIYPITLRYYLHLFNEKQKKIDQNKQILLLYNKTVSPTNSSRSATSHSSINSVNFSCKNDFFNSENDSISTDSSFNFEIVRKKREPNRRSMYGNFLSGKKKIINKNSKSTAHLENELTEIIDKIMSSKQRSKSEYKRHNDLKNTSPLRSRSKYKIKTKNRASKSYDQKFSSQNSLDAWENSLDFQHQGEAIKTRKEVKFSIDTENSGGGLVTAEIKLDDKMVLFDLKKISDTKYELKLEPKQVGEYKIYMFLNNQSVKGSPFSIKIDSLNNIESQNLSFNKIDKKNADEKDSKRFDKKLTHYPVDLNPNFKTDVFELTNKNEDLIVGEEVKLNVRIIDYGQKSKQKLDTKIDTKITHNEKLVEHELDFSSIGIYQIRFFPIETGIYNVYFFKNGTKIEGCPYKLNVKGRFLRSLLKPKYAQVGVPYILNVEYCNVTNLKAIVYTEKDPSISMPSKNITKLLNLPVEKTIQSDSKLRLKFVPLYASQHIIDIVDNGVSIEGFPIKIDVFPNKEIFLVTENTNGVQVDSLARFRIYLNGVKDSLNIRITNIDSGNRQFATFLLDQEYQLSNHIFAALSKFLKIDQNRIKNRDVTIENGYTRVSFTIEEEDQLPNNSVLKILKQIIENEKFIIIDLSLNTTIKAIINSFNFGPKGDNVGFKLTKQSNKAFDYLGEFKPTSFGRYRIDVENFNIPINSSPFFINVFDPNLIKIVNLPSSINLGNESSIEIDRSSIGFSELETTIQSSSGIKLPFKIDSSFNHIIRFIAREKGIHKFSMKLGDYLIKDHMFEINTLEKNILSVYGHGLFNGIENTYSVFYSELLNSKLGKVEIDIYDPCGNMVKNYTNKLNDFLYEIKYIPNRIGKFKIYIKFNGELISPNPYTANVINPDKVTIKDDCQYFFSPRNVDLEMNQEKYFCFNTMDAGEGDIRLDIIAPNNQILPYIKKSSNQNEQKISFCPVFKGLYKIHVFFNNHELRFSPICTRTNGFLDTNSVRVFGDGVKKASLNKETNFFIDMSNLETIGSNLKPTVTAISTEYHSLKFDLKQINDKMFNCIYTPDKIGNYLLSIKLNDYHICESPLILNVEMSTDPTKIIIEKSDFKNTILGSEVSTIIDTREAGNGELSASCLGLTKPSECQFTDLKNGTYELKIKPKEIGKHFLNLKYNNIHVSNSPFIFRVSGPPDETKVQVFGPGINHGVIGEFKSNFICDTRGAGAGQLTVRIRGPKGAFRVDMQRKDEKDRRIECSYDPMESGEYQINVKWSGKHVPKSPFNVHIFKTKEELENFLSESIKDENSNKYENEK